VNKVTQLATQKIKRFADKMLMQPVTAQTSLNLLNTAESLKALSFAYEAKSKKREEPVLQSISGQVSSELHQQMQICNAQEDRQEIQGLIQQSVVQVGTSAQQMPEDVLEIGTVGQAVPSNRRFDQVMRDPIKVI
jgi:hypothetical protein